MNEWRLIDTGLRKASENIALNQSILESHQAKEIPNTLRYLQFSPSALLGFHQNAKQELKLDYCKATGIEVQRRLTGGGAIYFDPSQLGWELYVERQFFKNCDMSEISKIICETAAKGISNLGVDARFRPRNDIEIGGRKVSGTGGAYNGDSILYQGTLLIDFDVEKMLKILHIPAEKLSDKAISSAKDRIVSLSELLPDVPSLAEIKTVMTSAFSSAFDLNFLETNELSPAEVTRLEQNIKEIDCDEWVYQVDNKTLGGYITDAIYKAKGGIIRASVSYDTNRNLIKQVHLTGDFFITPPRAINDLEAFLKDTPFSALSQRILDFFREHDIKGLMLSPDDFVEAISLAIKKVPQSEPA